MEEERWLFARRGERLYARRGEFLSCELAGTLRRSCVVFAWAR